MSNGVQAQALHVNGLTPHTDQQYTYIMTCNPCARAPDIKEIIKDILHFVSDHPVASYDNIQFTEVNIAGGEWRNLLIRLRIDSPSHGRLHGVLLHQPDSFISTAQLDNNENDILPWFEPPYHTSPLPIVQLQIPANERSREAIATSIKHRWQPNYANPKQLRFFTVPLSAENITSDDLTSYSECEANTVFISFDIQDNDSGITSSALTGKTTTETRRLLTIATCAVQFTYATRHRDPDVLRLTELSHALNFPEIRKISTTSPTFIALCSTPSDAFTLIDTKSLLIPFARTSLLITFSPIKDIGAHSLMTAEEVAAQLNFREHFYQGGLSIQIKATVRLPPDTLFQLLLLTLLSYQQNGIPPTSMGQDNGAAPYLPDLLEATPRDRGFGFRPAPWITPNVATADKSLNWTCLDRAYSATVNHTLSFCPGSTVRGEIKPYFITNPCAIWTNTLAVSIVDNAVFQRALFSGTRPTTHA
jgi:hypothetical protein